MTNDQTIPAGFRHWPLNLRHCFVIRCFVICHFLILALAAPLTRGEAPASRAATAPTTKPADARDTVIVDPETEKTIRGSLKFLAAQQSPTGAWASPGGEHPLAVTGYTLMAFLAAGQLPNEGEYGKNVAAGANFILSCVRPDGYITSTDRSIGRKQSNMYDHGIAAIALGEVYGQTQDPKLKEKLQTIVRLIVSAQNQQGGWRYTPRPESADISVTVLQVVALRVAKNGGLDVPQKTIDAAVKYVKSCNHKQSGGFCYQPGAGPGFARTAAAIYSLQVCGLYDDELIKPGSEFLIKHGSDREWFTYGNFYAAPAQYMVGGPTWEKWYAQIKKELLPAVKREGDMAFWDERDARGIGPVYATAVYTMMLSMPYHYVPLYQR